MNDEIFKDWNDLKAKVQPVGWLVYRLDGKDKFLTDNLTTAQGFAKDPEWSIKPVYTADAF
jgi:hypothetical protein